MKQIFLDGAPSRYYIHKDGRLQNREKGNFLKGTIRGGYRWFDLRANGKKYARSQHRLLAEAFIPNPNGLPVVNHKDSNRLNNDLSNLEWATYSENNLAQNRKPTGINHEWDDRWDFTNEEWKTFRDTRYMVSTYGRVKNAETGKIMKGKITGAGYREYCLRFNNKRNSLSAHRLVWEVWKGGSPEVVDHINADKLDNRIENLQALTYRDNVIKSYYKDGNRAYLKEVGRCDGENNLLQVYPTCAAAARDMGVLPQSINAAIHKNRRSCGFWWRYLDN